jgi:transcriptional regulator with XRE-family HTH domain
VRISMSGDSTPKASFADRLDRLFREVHPPNRGPYAAREVAETIEQRTGVSISAGAIQALRTGTRTNPKQQTIQALADFFGVSPAYFFGEEQSAQSHAEVQLRAAMRDAGVRQVAMRAGGLSSASLELITSLIEKVRAAEGLPESTLSGPADEE